VAARFAPDHEPQVSRGGAPERHRWAGLGFHLVLALISKLRRAASDRLRYGFKKFPYVWLEILDRKNGLAFFPRVARPMFGVGLVHLHDFAGSKHADREPFVERGSHQLINFVMDTGVLFQLGDGDATRSQKGFEPDLN
jgi:hypothetical protein